MIFAAPKLLWLLLVPATVAVWDLARRRRRGETNHPNILRAEAGPTSVTLASEKTKRPVDGAPRLRPWLWFGLAFAIVAIARPQWGRIEEPVFDQSREILLAVDLSRSMLAPDVSPSRLDRAKLLIQSLLEKLAGERVGLVVFAGTSFLQAPLSADYEILREFLPGLNPGIWNVSVVAVMRELAAAIREGRPLARGATFVDGLANQKVLDAVRLSGTERRWVQP